MVRTSGWPFGSIVYNVLVPKFFVFVGLHVYSKFLLAMFQNTVVWSVGTFPHLLGRGCIRVHTYMYWEIALVCWAGSHTN